MAVEIEMNTLMNVVPTTPISDGICSLNLTGTQLCCSSSGRVQEMYPSYQKANELLSLGVVAKRFTAGFLPFCA